MSQREIYEELTEYITDADITKIQGWLTLNPNLQVLDSHLVQSIPLNDAPIFKLLFSKCEDRDPTMLMNACIENDSDVIANILLHIYDYNLSYYQPAAIQRNKLKIVRLFRSYASSPKS